MTDVDPFTTPAEAEREDMARQARDFLALAMAPEHLAKSTWIQGNDYRYSYEDGVQAVRDALVGQGHALLAVRDELADIAGSLRTLAKTPAAIEQLAEQVSDAGQTVKNSLSEIASEVLGCNEATALGAMDVAAAIHETGEIVDSAMFGVVDVMDRPRWWQWRRQRAERETADQRFVEAGVDSLAALTYPSTHKEVSDG